MFVMESEELYISEKSVALYFNICIDEHKLTTTTCLYFAERLLKVLFESRKNPVIQAKVETLRVKSNYETSQNNNFLL